VHLGIQQALENIATQSAAWRAVFIFCATILLYVLAAAWVVVALAHARSLTLASAVRIVALLALAYVIAKLLHGVVSDPRPFLVDHRPALTTVSTDNGFPSDHVLLASALTISLWWIDRRWIVPFALATLVLMCGRMGIGAHHLEDVAGSALICLALGIIVGLVPLRGWLERPVFGMLWSATGRERKEHPARK
jgi:membrane-associated phospholipid phosphatase